MLLRFAKIAGGLRLLIAEVAPLVFAVGARSVAYVIGFLLGNIASAWLPIVALLVSVAGVVGSNTAECEAYRAQMRAIDTANRALMVSYEITLKPYVAARLAWNDSYVKALNNFSAANNAVEICASSCQMNGISCYFCFQGVFDRVNRLAADAVGSPPVPPPLPTFQTYPACSSPNCPPGKKVWVQVLWGSPTGNFVDSKGCFIVAYSQDAPDIPVNIEYNPFLPKKFVESRPISYYLVDGDRFRGLVDNDWKNLESVSGWDKGYWKAEHTDPECRGWRPGWSRKIK